jgi:hypothetical protein
MTQVNYFLSYSCHLGDSFSALKLEPVPLTIIKGESVHNIETLFGPVKAGGTVLTTREND